jgi:hypothetical protein
MVAPAVRTSWKRPAKDNSRERGNDTESEQSKLGRPI